MFGKIFQVYCRHLKLDTFKIQFAYRFQTIRGKKKNRTKTSQVSSTKDRKEKKKKLKFMVNRKKKKMAEKVQTHQ